MTAHTELKQQHKESELLYTIYDTLFKNTDREQFSCDDMHMQEVDREKGTITFYDDTTEYMLTLTTK